MTEYVFRPLRSGVRSRLFYGRYKIDGMSAPRTVALKTPDKTVARARLRKLIVEAQRVSEGLIAPAPEREAAALPLRALVGEYIFDLNARGRSKKHIEATAYRVTAVLAGTGWKRLSDIRADEFVKWRGTLKRAAKTVREYQAAINMFLNWLLRLDRIARNPLVKVPQVETRGKQVRATRALTPPELVALFTKTQILWTGARRVAVYRFLAYTGCRLGEAKSLVWGDCNLGEVPPHILLREGETKDRTARVIPLHSQLAQMLRDMRPEGVAADVRVFKTFPGPMTLDRDLVRAGIVKRDLLGRTVAFHSFRKSFQTMGVRAGINQRAAQALLGHSDANHTAKIYTDIPTLGHAAEVEKLLWLRPLPENVAAGSTPAGVPASERITATWRFREFCADLLALAKDGVFESVAKENPSVLEGLNWCGQRESNPLLMLGKHT